MGSDDEGIHQFITADASQATPAFQEVIDLAARLFAGLESTSAAGKTAGRSIAEAGAVGADGLKLIPPPAEKAALSLEAISAASTKVSGHLGAIGVEAGAAAEGLEVLTGALGTLEATMGPLLLIAGVVAAIGAAFSLFKDGAAAAEDLQSELETLGAAVESQGGKWSAMKDGVERWIGQEAMASGFLREQLTPALNALVTSGLSVADSQKVLAVAEEVAIAHHQGVLEVTNKLIQAEAGRGNALVKLDTHLKPLIASHATYSQVLQMLHRDNENQITDGDSLERAAARRKVEMEGLSIAIGEKLLPILTNLETTMLGGIQIGEHFGAAWIHSFASIEDAIKAAGDGLAAFFGPVKDFKAHWHDAQVEMGKAHAESDASNKELGLWWNAPDAFTKGQQIVAGAVKAHAADTSDLGGLNQRMGVTPKTTSSSSTSATETVTEYGHWAEATDDVKTKQTALAIALAATDGTEARLSENVKTATTIEGQRAAQAALSAQVIEDLQRKETLLNATIADETTAVKTLTSEHDQAVTVYNRLVDAHQALAARKEKNHGLSADEEVQLKNLEDALKRQSDTITGLNTQIDSNNTALDANNKALAANTTQIAANASAKSAAAAAMSIAWQNFNDAESARMAESQATFAATNAQKVVIYRDMLAHLNTADEDFEKKREDLTKRIDDAVLSDEQDTYKARLDAAKQFTDAVQSKEIGFLDDLLSKHESLRDSLKSIWDDVKSAFVKDIEEMIVKGAAFTSLNHWLFGGAAGGAGGAGASGGSGGLLGGIPGITSSAQQGAAQYGLLGALVGTGGAPQILGSMSAAGGGGGGPALGTNGWGLDGWDTGTSPTTYAKGGGLSSLIGSGLQAVGLGNLGSSLTGGNSLGGSIGGLAGSAIGDMIGKMIGTGFGPAGMVVGSLLGGAIGGLFGPHETAAETPDSSDPNYNQLLANWQGNTINSPQGQVSPTNQYWTANGGTSQSQQISQMIDTANLSSLTSAQQSIVQQLISLNGGTSGNNLAVTDEHQGVVTLVSGKKISVSDWESLISQYTTAFGNSSGSSPVYTLGRTYPDFNLSTLNNTGTSASPGAGSAQYAGGVQVIIQGNVVGPGGLQTVATAIGQVLQRGANGQIIGSPSTWRGIGPSLGRLNGSFT